MRILRSRKFWMILGVVLIICLTPIAGSLFEWPMIYQILIVIVIIFLFLLFLMYVKLQVVKSAVQIEESIKAQADQNLMGYGAEKREEIEQLSQKLSKAIASLKSSKLGKGKRGSAALYALPWYMFIGPPGAGKTTAIENSGLEFPFGSEGIQGVGGTRNCDWYFSNSAILLDTAGRYTTEDEDREEWFTFLDILKKHRKRKPINGIIIGVSIADLINASNEELESHATRIRSRIDELMERLGVRFPTYLIFTKCDLLQGFIEFFEDFSRVEHEQIWGCTFTKSQQSNSDPGQLFSEKIDELFNSLKSFRLSRLLTSVKREERRKIYGFPMQIRSEQDKLCQFVGKLFYPSRYEENPIFRGFYFTSGTQEGTPIDRAIQEIAKQIDLPLKATERFDPKIEKKSYFVKELFTKIIIPDQNLVMHTSRMATRLGIIKFGSLAAILLALVLFFIFVINTSIRNNKDLKAFYNAPSRISQIKWERNSIKDNFNRLGRFKSKMLRLEDAPFMSGSIYQGEKVLEYSWMLYNKSLAPFVSTYLFNGILIKQLSDYSAYKNNIIRDQAYKYLNAYLLMSKNRDKLADSEAEKNILKQELTKLLDQLFSSGQFNFRRHVNDANLEALASSIKENLNYFVETLAHIPADQISEEYIYFDANESLIRQVRNRLGPTNISDVYERIKREGMTKDQPYSLEQLLQGQGRYTYFFLENVELSSLFTKEKWENYVSEEIKKACQYPGQDDWVLGENAGQLTLEKLDKDEMKKKLEDLYFRDYAKAWWNFLKKIKYREFDNLNIAVRRLEILGNYEESPLRLLFEKVTQQTNLEGKVKEIVQEIAEPIAETIDAHPINRQFSRIHDLVKVEGGNLPNVLKHYVDLSTFLEGYSEGPIESIAEFAAGILENRNSNKLYIALNEINQKLRMLESVSRRNIFEQPIIWTWKTILQKAQIHLNNLWSEKVYNVYSKTIENKYPFNKISSSEVGITDVASFFNNSGYLWDFVNNDLSAFVRENSWTSQTWENFGIHISNKTRGALRKADQITKSLGLVDQNEISLKFFLTPDQPIPKGSLDKIILDIDGEENIYRMGKPREHEFNWPSDKGSRGASLTIKAKTDRYDLIKFESPWGWFKLLDQTSSINRLSSTRYKMQWRFSPNNNYNIAIYYELRTETSNHPFGDYDFFNFTLPKRLN